MTRPMYFNFMCEYTRSNGQWLKNELYRRDMTIKQLAKLTGLHPNSISGYVNDTHDPSLSAALKIADVLGYEIILREKDKGE